MTAEALIRIAEALERLAPAPLPPAGLGALAARLFPAG